jgi:hypothetical protein
MKKLILISMIAAALLVPVILSSCIPILTPVGPTATRDYNLTGFTKVESGSGFATTVTRGDSYAVSVTTNENLFNYLDVYVSGDTLVIKARPLTVQTFSTLKAEVTMPELQGIDFSGGSRGRISGFSANTLSVSASGGSNLEMDLSANKIDMDLSGGSRVNGSITASSSDISLSGGSNIEIKGSGGDLALTLSGGSRASLQQFETGSGTFVLRDGSSGYIDINSNMDVTLSGGSRLNYSGNPQIGSIEVTGGSELHKA